MKKWIILAACVGFLVPAGALAQNREDEGLRVGDYAPSIEAAEWLNVESADEIPSLVELRGLVVVLFFWVSWHGGGEALLPYVNMFSYNSSIGREGGVYTIGITDADRRATQPLIDDAKIFFPVAVGSKSAEEYGFRDGFGFVVVGPDGKIIFKDSGRGDISGMINSIGEAIGNNPPFKTHPEEAGYCDRKMNETVSLIEQGRYPRTRRIMFDAFERAVLGDRLKSEIAETNDLIEQLGYDQLAQFEPLIEQKKYLEAARHLREVIKRFKGFDCYRDAKALYERYREENEEFKRAAAHYDNEDTAAKLYLEARDALQAHRFGECFEKLNKVVTDYSRTEAAEYAEAMLARMRKNTKVWAMVRDYQAGSQCQQMLARARNLIGDGQYQEAETILRQILKDHPNTSWAEEAVGLLKTMP